MKAMIQVKGLDGLHTVYAVNLERGSGVVNVKRRGVYPVEVWQGEAGELCAALRRPLPVFAAPYPVEDAPRYYEITRRFIPAMVAAKFRWKGPGSTEAAKVLSQYVAAIMSGEYGEEERAAMVGFITFPKSLDI